MSQYYVMDDQTLWNPSNGASRLFLRQVEVFEAELELPSGFLPLPLRDECAVDKAALAAFVDALLTRHRATSHGVLLALSEGFVAAVLVLADRAGVDVDWARLSASPDGPRRDIQVSAGTGMSAPAQGDAWMTGLRDRARELGRHMAL
ncbi:DUF6086 family protein [Streptomyces laurentii]|uniref:DUF6086 family protein n=1 Tax=Streptomyces laurentii TaxID=39478 RepID=UPI0036C5A208